MIRYKNYILWPDKVEKRHFVRFFLSVVGVLFVIRLLFPSVMTRVVRMLQTSLKRPWSIPSCNRCRWPTRCSSLR